MKVKKAWIGETDSYMVNTEDGPVEVFNFVVFAQIDKAIMRYGDLFASRYEAEEFLAEVARIGIVDEMAWVTTKARESLESRWSEGGTAWQEEQEDERK